METEERMISPGKCTCWSESDVKHSSAGGSFIFVHTWNMICAICCHILYVNPSVKLHLWVMSRGSGRGDSSEEPGDGKRDQWAQGGCIQSFSLTTTPCSWCGLSLSRVLLLFPGRQRKAPFWKRRNRERQLSLTRRRSRSRRTNGL